MLNDTDSTKRVLVIDDNVNLYEDLERIFNHGTGVSALSELEAQVLGEGAESKSVDEPAAIHYQLEHAAQGEEGVQRIQQALADGHPYPLAFVDMRMPPGWDGLKTIHHIWQVDPCVQVVICTAYSDHPWCRIHAELGESDNWLVLKKPFDPIEVIQLASALTHKWDLARQAGAKLSQLEAMVQEQTEVIFEAQRVAERAEEAKSSFFRGMCQRLRPSIQSILDYSEHITEDPLTDAQSRFLTHIRTSSNHLLRIIDDLQEVSQLDLACATED